MAYIVCTSNLDLVSFLFVPALYSTLKLEIFPFTCITRYGSTLYIGIAMVVPILQYIRKCQFVLSVSSEFDF